MAGKACSGPSLRSALRPFYGRKRRPFLDCYCALDRSTRRPGDTGGRRGILAQCAKIKGLRLQRKPSGGLWPPPRRPLVFPGLD